MIRLQLNPAGVERVVFKYGGSLEFDLDTAALMAIRPLVNRIDRQLRQVAKEAFEGFPDDVRPAPRTSAR